MSQRGKLTARVLERRLWGEAPLLLLDVGCSGGIDERWKVFGDRLRAIGFDPLVTEIDRLNAANTSPHTRYEAAFVTCRGFDELFPPALRNDHIASKNNQPFPRSSAAAAQHRMQTSYVQQMFNAGAPIVFADRSITLDEYFPRHEYGHVDFIKIDTDGHDIEVLLGATAQIAAGSVLGLTVEAQFHGATHEYANTFSNIDRLLRNQGFTLFDLETYRYSRAELPAPFESALAGQTRSGQTTWGEAVYFRDLGDPAYEQMWQYDITPERVLKLACLFDQIELPDCAAELLLNRGDFLATPVREELLDLLVTGEPGSYRAHIAAFNEDFTRFYPSGMRKAIETPPLAQGAGHEDAETIRQLRDRVEDLTHKSEGLRRKLAERDERLEWMTNRVAELKSKRRQKREEAPR